MTIKAIETRYKGYRFRSRLEARWAVFFDGVGIQWEYESEGFDTGSARYLPDFRFPAFLASLSRGQDGHDHLETYPKRVTVWLEIKPATAEMSDADKQKLISFAASELGDAIVMLAMGDPFAFALFYLFPDLPHEKRCRLVPCVILGPPAGSRDVEAPVVLPGPDTDPAWFFDAVADLANQTLLARTFARSARFEHGETPS